MKVAEISLSFMSHQIIYLAKHLPPTFLLEFQFKFTLKNKCVALTDEKPMFAVNRREKHEKLIIKREFVFVMPFRVWLIWQGGAEKIYKHVNPICRSNHCLPKDSSSHLLNHDTTFLLPLVWKVKVKVTQSCLTLSDPMDCIVHVILQARILEWVAFPFSRGSSQPRDQTQVSHFAGVKFTCKYFKYLHWF